jgi:hypothetical protein
VRIDALDTVLAEHTGEALRIVRRGALVYKFLRPHENFRPSADGRLRQLRLRVRESRRWPETNPLTFDQSTRCLISPYIAGRPPTRQEVLALRAHLRAMGRGYLEDVSRHNVLVTDGRPILIDFAVNEDHPDFPTAGIR